MISPPSGSPMILVFWTLVPNFIKKFERGHPERSANKGGVGKFCSFLSLSVNISKTVADTAKVTIYDC